MSALDKIAELHVAGNGTPAQCCACSQWWPCPTHRLCDEAADERATTARVALDAMAERDVARADAERLAALLDVARADLTWRDALASEPEPEADSLLRDAARSHFEGCTSSYCWLCEVICTIDGKPYPVPRERWVKVIGHEYDRLKALEAGAEHLAWLAHDVTTFMPADEEEFYGEWDARMSALAEATAVFCRDSLSPDPEGFGSLGWDHLPEEDISDGIVIPDSIADIAHLVHSLGAERDAARADAERLAAAMRDLGADRDGDYTFVLRLKAWAMLDAWLTARAALVAHDALTGDKK